MSEPVFQDPRFDALRNAIYHTERRTFLDWVNRSLNFWVIILGAGVAANIATQLKIDGRWLEFGVVLLATAQLVFDFGGRARTHEFLQKRYYEMLSEMEADNIESQEVKAKWSGKLLTIAADEPLTMRALDALAYNKAVDALVSDVAAAQSYRLHVGWWQRRLRQFIAFDGAQFLPIEQHRGLLSRCSALWKRKTRQDPA
jgi:hypothetical protein